MTATNIDRILTWAANSCGHWATYLNVAADAATDEGNDAMAAGLRWAARNRKKPVGRCWGRDALGQDAANGLPGPVWDRLDSAGVGEVYAGSGEGESVVLAFASQEEAWAALAVAADLLPVQ